MLWDPFLMKKLLKSVICGFVNSAPYTVHGRLGQQLWLKKKKNKGKHIKKKLWTRKRAIQTHTRYQNRNSYIN